MLEAKGAVTHLLVYSKRFFSDEAVARYAAAIAELQERILHADSLESLTVEELLRGTSC